MAEWGVEFRIGQCVRVRNTGVGGLQPEQRWLGKEGTIRDIIGGPPTIYVVEFDGGDDGIFTPDFLEPK